MFLRSVGSWGHLRQGTGRHCVLADKSRAFPTIRCCRSIPIGIWVWAIRRRSVFAVTQIGEVRLIDYYEASGEGFQHYAGVLKARGYVYGTHWAPHDIAVRELGTGKSRWMWRGGLA